MGGLTPIDNWTKAEFFFLNPHYPVSISWEGITFGNLRLAFEASKTQDFRLRKQVAAMQSWQASQWGINKPDPATDWGQEWLATIERKLLYWTADKFGMIYPGPSHKEKTKLGYWLVSTWSAPLVYTSHTCDTFLGKCLCDKHTKVINSPATAEGRNILGNILDTVRAHITDGYVGEDYMDENCDFCFEKRDQKLTQSTILMLWRVKGALHRRVTCDKHIQLERTMALEKADGHELYIYPIAAMYSDGVEKQQKVLALHAPNPQAAAYVHSANYTSSDKKTWGSIAINPHARTPVSNHIVRAQ